jgi:hypothetical protein
MDKLNRFDIQKMVEFVSQLDIMKNPEPAAIFDPLLQGFNVWAIASDHPGGDWERIVGDFDSGAYTKRSEYVGCAFYNWSDGSIHVTTDAYGLGDHLPNEYARYSMSKMMAKRTGKKSIRNRPDDVKWVIEKVKWVFEQINIPCPPIVVGEDD